MAMLFSCAAVFAAEEGGSCASAAKKDCSKDACCIAAKKAGKTCEKCAPKTDAKKEVKK